MKRLKGAMNVQLSFWAGKFLEWVVNRLRFSIGSFDLRNHQVGKLSQKVTNIDWHL